MLFFGLILSYGRSYLLFYRRLILFILFLFSLIYIYIYILKQTCSIKSLSINEIHFKTKDRIESPFSNTLGFIRWNSPYRERIILMNKYRPFFNELHYSIPDYSSQLNYTQDGFISIKYPYYIVSQTMNIILQNYSNIQGLLYFHFDAWINPLRFDDMNFDQIWFIDGSFPPFKCVTNIHGWDWWVWTEGFHHIVKNATKHIQNKYPNQYLFNQNIFCGGWSDIYYIPRRFFVDFIKLSNVFYGMNVFHEVAIPTMIYIIDQTYRSTPFHSVITRIRDCWGNCCSSGSTSNDIQDKRCGHRMNLTHLLIQKTLTTLLDTEASYLNKTKTNRIH